MPKKKKRGVHRNSSASAPQSTASIQQLLLRAKAEQPLTPKEKRSLPRELLIGDDVNPNYLNPNGALNASGISILRRLVPDDESVPPSSQSHQPSVLQPMKSFDQTAEERRQEYYTSELKRYKKHHPICRVGLIKDFQRLPDDENNDPKRAFISSELNEMEIDSAQPDTWLTRAVELNDRGLLIYLKKQITRDNIMVLLQTAIGMEDAQSVLEYLIPCAKKMTSSEIAGLEELLDSLTVNVTQQCDEPAKEMTFNEIHPQIYRLEKLENLMRCELAKVDPQLKGTDTFIQFMCDCYKLLQFVLPVDRFVMEKEIGLLDCVWSISIPFAKSPANEIQQLANTIQECFNVYGSMIGAKQGVCAVGANGDIAIILKRNMSRPFDCQKTLNTLIMILMLLSTGQKNHLNGDIRLGSNDSHIQIIISGTAVAHHQINSKKMDDFFVQVKEKIFDPREARVIRILRLICDYRQNIGNAVQNLQEIFSQDDMRCLKVLMSQEGGALFKVSFLNQLIDCLDSSLKEMYRKKLVECGGVPGTSFTFRRQ